jgi:hypothetical protein
MPKSTANKLTNLQIEALSKYFVDLSKILFASAVVGFFIPGYSGEISILTFVLGALFSVGLVLLGILIIKPKDI